MVNKHEEDMKTQQRTFDFKMTKHERNIRNKHQASAKILNIANPQNEQIGSELWWLMVLILVSSPKMEIYSVISNPLQF
jgi:hypothetical protein